MTEPTQTEIVLSMLMNSDAVCGTDWYRHFLPRATARIFELRRQGYVISRQRCSRPGHDHKNPQWEWSLIAVPERAGS